MQSFLSACQENSGSNSGLDSLKKDPALETLTQGLLSQPAQETQEHKLLFGALKYFVLFLFLRYFPLIDDIHSVPMHYRKRQNCSTCGHKQTKKKSKSEKHPFVSCNTPTDGERERGGREEEEEKKKA